MEINNKSAKEPQEIEIGVYHTPYIYGPNGPVPLPDGTSTLIKTITAESEEEAIRWANTYMSMNRETLSHIEDCPEILELYKKNQTVFHLKTIRKSQKPIKSK